MKEQWTDDLRNKLEGYESPLLPDELWDDIDKEMSASRRIVPISVGARLVQPFSYLSQSPSLCFFSVKSIMKALL